jgi:hypothetical protein
MLLHSMPYLKLRALQHTIACTEGKLAKGGSMSNKMIICLLAVIVHTYNTTNSFWSSNYSLLGKKLGAFLLAYTRKPNFNYLSDKKAEQGQL